MAHSRLGDYMDATENMDEVENRWMMGGLRTSKEASTWQHRQQTRISH